MPFLDVSDLLTDPDFCERLLCARQQQTVNGDGLAVNAPPLNLKFRGVVTAAKGYELKRDPEGELITGTIIVITRFRLRDGKSGPNESADIVQIGTRSYTVTNTQDYSRYGRGFIQATCDLLPLGGTYPPPPGLLPTYSQR
jgi:galactose-6-phosphate isomerase